MALAGLPVLGQRVAVCARARAAGRFLVRGTLGHAALSVGAEVVLALARCLILGRSETIGAHALLGARPL